MAGEETPSVPAPAAAPLAQSVPVQTQPTLTFGVTTPAQPIATPPPAAPQPAAPVQTQPGVTLTRAEYDQFLQNQVQLSAHLQAETQRAAEAERLRLKAIADKDGSDAALKAANELATSRLAEKDATIASNALKYLNAQKSAALLKATAATPWVSPEAARAAMNELNHHFDASELPDGSIKVVDRATLRPADQVIPELLKSPAFSFYLRGATGGVGAPNSMVTPGVTPPDMVAPANPGQEAYAHFYAQRNAQQQQGYGAIGIPGMAGSIPVNMQDLTRRN